MADNQVRAAVVVQVADGDAAAEVFGLEIRTAVRRDVDEAAGLVAQQDGPLPPAGLLRIAEYVAVGDEKVGPAVVVHVEEAGAEANVLLTDSRDPRNPGAEQKESSALIAIEAMHFMLVVADPKRSPAAAVVIATVHAHAAVGHAAIIAGHTADQAGLFQPDLPRYAALQVQEIVHRVVSHIDVRLAVAIEIGNDHAQSLAAFAVLERVPGMRPQSGFLADIGEGAVAVVPEELVR